MTDLYVDHAATEAAADGLTKASDQMHTAMEECLSAVRAASEPLSGLLHSATLSFYDVLRQADLQMGQDVADAARVLRGMHGDVTDGDAQGAAQFPHELS